MLRTVCARAPAAVAIAAMSASGNCTRETSWPIGREVVDLGAVGGVVVDQHQQLQAQAGRGLELGQRHERAAVADRRHRQAVRPGHRGADRVAEPQPDRLKAVGEHPGAGVGHAQVHRRVAEEVPGVDRHRLVGRQQALELDRQRPRVDPLLGGGVLVGVVGPAAARRSRRRGPGVRKPVLGVPAALELVGQSRRAAARASPITARSAGRLRPIARGLDVDLRDLGVGRRPASRGASSSG